MDTDCLILGRASSLAEMQGPVGPAVPDRNYPGRYRELLSVGLAWA